VERRHWFGLALAGLAILASVLVTQLPSPAPQQQETRTLRGQITLTTTHVRYMTGRLGEECYGAAHFQDMTAGTQVRVYDQSNTVLATGVLTAGAWYDSCRFWFTVPDVPERPVVQVEVGGHGRVPFEWVDVETGGVKLTLGP
jgi:hypothetical protein